MTDLALTLRQDHLDCIKSLILRSDGSEGACLLLLAPSHVEADPWSGRPTTRFLSRSVIPIPDTEVVSRAYDHIKTTTRPLAMALGQAADEGLVVAFVHSHPEGPLAFSEADDIGEADQAILARNRNGDGTRLASLLVTGDGDLACRVWTHPLGAQAVDRITVIGDRIALHGEIVDAVPEAFHRQGLAFGDNLYRAMSGLRIGIVGCGATGSAMALLLGRLGIRRVALFDPDTVETTNLNRLHGATMDDALSGRCKINVARGMLEGFGLSISVVATNAWIGAPEAQDMLKSCDVVFGCTDDHDGRMLLNRLAFVYSIPLIDMGIRIDPGASGEPVRGAAGRVTVVMPGSRCLICRGVVNPVRAREEQIERTDPEEYLAQRQQGYIVGQDVPNPAVVHLTTDIACMAVDELVHRLTGYRAGGASQHRVRHFHSMQDRAPGVQAQHVCRVCDTEDDWSKGDTLSPFLGRVG